VILHLLDDARLDGDDLEVLSRAIDLARRERQAGETRGT
jgi:hypothetical protein